MSAIRQYKIQQLVDAQLAANTELAFQNAEKEERADELAIVNKQLALQTTKKKDVILALSILNTIADEKESRAAELVLLYEQNMLLSYQVNHMQKLESIGR